MRGGAIRGLNAVIAVSIATAAAPVFAQQDPAIVLTVESSDPRVQAEGVRQALGQRLGRSVVGLADARGNELHVVVAIGREGPAAVVLRASDEEPRLMQIVRGPHEDWVVRGLVSALSAERGRPAGLRSWSGETVVAPPRSLLRPWPDPGLEPRRARYRIQREWLVGGPAPETGAALSAPSPSR